MLNKSSWITENHVWIIDLEKNEITNLPSHGVIAQYNHYSVIILSNLPY